MRHLSDFRLRFLSVSLAVTNVWGLYGQTEFQPAISGLYICETSKRRKIDHESINELKTRVLVLIYFQNTQGVPNRGRVATCEK
jgi:hypothetical protein